MGGNPSKPEAAAVTAAAAAPPPPPPPVTNSCKESQSIKARIHQGPIHSICPLGQDILSGGVDKNVSLYCCQKNNCTAKFKGPTKDITKICYNNTSRLVYSSSRDRSLYGWKWLAEQEGEQEEEQPSTQSLVLVKEPSITLTGHTLGVTSLDCSDEHPQLLCSGSRDNSICLWDVDIGKPVSSMYVPRNVVTDIKWITSEKSVVQSSEDKTLRVWDLSSCSTVQHFRARNFLQTCCDISSDRLHFLAGSSGGELNLWDRRNEKKPVQQYQGHIGGVESCMFLSYEDTNLICSAGKDSTIRLWELDSGQELHCQFLSGSGPLTDLTSPSTGKLACSSFSGGISLWTLTANDKILGLTFHSQYT